MVIELSPELEALVLRDIERGAFRNVEEFVAQAVTELHEREEWLAAHRDEIRAKIEEGWAEAQRGEVCSIEDVKQEMATMKLEWLAEHKRA